MKKIFFLLLLVLTVPFASAKTLTGLDVLKSENFKAIEGANVGLITNQTGRSSDGYTVLEVFTDTDKVRLKCLMSPEHGFDGKQKHGEEVADSTDSVTGIPVYSLYGKTSRLTDEMLKGVDTLVYDIQDVGTRFYTYITTMAQAMEEAAKHKIKFVVLDRPNPIRGDIVEGDVLDPDVKRLTGYFQIPVRYGLTIGELALWYNETQKIGAKVVVVPLKKWKRNSWYDQTGLDFVPPSPNIPNLISAILYAGIGCFEATNVSVGRGTSTPFEIFGAPWIDGKALCAYLREQNFPGVTFEPIGFNPVSDLYENTSCEGVRMIVTDRNKIRPFQIFLASFVFLVKNYPNDFKPDWEEIRVVTGSRRLQEGINKGTPLEELLGEYDKVSETFTETIRSYYLY